MIFTQPTQMEYTCSLCKRRWRTPDVQVACCVLHPPGTCCHYGETEITVR